MTVSRKSYLLASDVRFDRAHHNTRLPEPGESQSPTLPFAGLDGRATEQYSDGISLRPRYTGASNCWVLLELDV